MFWAKISNIKFKLNNNIKFKLNNNIKFKLNNKYIISDQTLVHQS